MDAGAAIAATAASLQLSDQQRAPAVSKASKIRSAAMAANFARWPDSGDMAVFQARWRVDVSTCGLIELA